MSLPACYIALMTGNILIICRGWLPVRHMPRLIVLSCALLYMSAMPVRAEWFFEGDRVYMLRQSEGLVIDGGEVMFNEDKEDRLRAARDEMKSSAPRDRRTFSEKLAEKSAAMSKSADEAMDKLNTQAAETKAKNAVVVPKYTPENIRLAKSYSDELKFLNVQINAMDESLRQINQSDERGRAAASMLNEKLMTLRARVPILESSLRAAEAQSPPAVPK